VSDPGLWQTRVRYAETDQMGVAHHSVYAVWFEAARVSLFDSLGLPYRQIEAEGCYLMLTRLEVEFRKAAHFDELLTVTAWPGEVGSRKLQVRYRITRQGDELARGHTEHVATDRSYRLTRLPENLLARLSHPGGDRT
jgi:acyl-CoA thioester hydrolase